MFDFLSKISSYLPLCIESVEWDGDVLNISGEGWRFTTNSVWRISHEKELLFGCWDDEVGIFLEELVGVCVVEFVWLINEQPIDPSLLLSNGRRLDVFCSSSYEPWVMGLSEEIYVGGFAGI